MRRIAAILLFVFGTVQVAPAVCAFFSPVSSVFIVDEEKADEKVETGKKDKKDNPFILQNTDELSRLVTVAFHLAEKIYPSPCLEKLTPPPNFC
jgi:hypothetical protein